MCSGSDTASADEIDTIWKLSASYTWGPKDGFTAYLIGDAPVDQTTQGVWVQGDFSSNRFVLQIGA